MYRFQKTASILALGWLTLGCAAVSHAENFHAGQQLSAQKIQQLGALPSYSTNAGSYQVLPSTEQASAKKSNTANTPSTLVLTPKGMVATSYHSVMVNDVPESQVRQALAAGPQPTNVTYFAPTGITMVRYADFAQTVEGLKALQASLPSSQVRLSLELGKQVPQ